MTLMHSLLNMIVTYLWLDDIVSITKNDMLVKVNICEMFSLCVNVWSGFAGCDSGS